MSIRLPYKTETDIVNKLKSKNLYTSNIILALEQSKKSHNSQKRDSGKSYLKEHIYPITFELIDRFHTHQDIEDIIILALLHDAIEDDKNLTKEEMLKTFGERITSYLLTLTKKEEENTSSLSEEKKYQINKKLIKQTQKSDFVVRIVKLADRLNNMRCLPIIRGTKKFDRYLKESENFFIPLAKNTSGYFYKEMRSLTKRFLEGNANI